MTRYFIGAILILSTLSAFAQKPTFSQPNYKKINKAINKESSSTFYPKLMKRFLANDTTLSPAEYHLLYFGYSLQPQYSPNADLASADSLMALIHKEQLAPAQYDLVIKYANSTLENRPFDMRYLDPLIYVYRMQGNNTLADKLEFKLGRIIETLFSTGDGLTKETAFHVISVEHEYDLLRALGFGNAGGQSLTIGQYDFLKVEANDYGIEGMYFNISAMQKK
ncbi:MAG: DUF4919 domain-containing protein [Lentimicrobium sp.]|nr:DUF4919 domain-containing protein [Lentimicrobium sp.]